METAKEKLSKYGKVTECDYRNGMYHFVIKDGFSDNAYNTFECLRECTEIAGPLYPHIEKMVTDKNMFHLVLKP